MTKMTGITCRIIICIVFIMGIIVHVASASPTKQLTGKNSELLRLEKTKKCPGCNLRGLTLNRMDLKGADLQGADLRNAKLHLVNLADANLRGTLLEGVVMVGADLSGADLRGAKLGEDSLDGAYIAGAVFDQQCAEKSEQFAEENITNDEAQSAAPLTGESGEPITVRSEVEVPIAKTSFVVPEQKKLQAIQSVTLDEEAEGQNIQTMQL